MERERTQFPLLGEPLAVDLANTVYSRRGRLYDALETPEQLSDWLRSQRDRLPAVSPSAQALADLRALRESVRQVFEAATGDQIAPQKALGTINRTAARVAAYPQLDWPDRLRIENGTQDPVELVLGAVGRSAIELLSGPNRERLRHCPGPECVLFFVATNPRRRWCGICGNRVRVARHYARRRKRSEGSKRRPGASAPTPTRSGSSSARR